MLVFYFINLILVCLLMGFVGFGFLLGVIFVVIVNKDCFLKM